MKKRPTQADDFDSPWKTALHRYLPSFLDFYFADIPPDVDWQRPYESLDKEFQQIIRHAKVGKCLADKLFKVWLKDGSERWLLVHVEIQGEYEEAFARRMFEYNVAARRLYGKTVVSLAVLCDERLKWRPSMYSDGHWGSKIELTFRMAKLLDYAYDLDALENSTNPFAAVTLAHLQAQRTHGDPATRKQWKLRLAKGLYRGQWRKEDVRELFRLIDWIMTLPEGLDEAFRAELHQYEEEKKMPYVTSVERLALQEGREEGLLEGREAGREEARIAELLEAKFGAAGRKLLPKVRALSTLAELRRFARYLKGAKSVDAVRSHLAE